MYKKIKRNFKYISTTIIAVSAMFSLFYFYTLSAFADTVVNLQYPSFASASSPNGFIGEIYTYALSIAGTLAIIMIIYGGIKYVANPGNTSQLTDATDIIKSAIIGILILGGAYLILSTINPNIVKLQNFGEVVVPVSTSTSTSTSRIAYYFGPTLTALPAGCSGETYHSVSYSKCEIEVSSLSSVSSSDLPGNCRDYILHGSRHIICTIHYKKVGDSYLPINIPTL